jgi:hypothetical protein
VAARDLDVLELYGESARLILAEPGKMLGLSAIGLAPSWIASLMSDSFLLSLVVLVLSLPLVALAHGGLVVLVAQLRGGGPAPGFRGLLSGPNDGYVRITTALVVISVILGVGFVLLLVPGLIALAFLWVAWPLVVLEDAPAMAAIKESSRLTAGHRLKITAIVMILIVLNLALGLLQATLTAAFGLLFGLGVGALVGTATTALALTLVTLSYFKLKDPTPAEPPQLSIH